MAGPQVNPAVEGETEDRVYQLLSDGEPFPIQGLDVVLILETKDGTLIDTATKVTVLDDGTALLRGRFAYSPASTDLTRAGSDYYLRVKVTDGDGKIAFWPGGEAARMKVYPVAKT